MEHAAYDIVGLKAFMQAMADPGATARRGYPGTDHPVIVRIPAYGREMNQWMAKQLLDHGVHGVRFPHIETVEQAQNAVRSMRYAHQPGDPDFLPDAQGYRGSGAGFAAGIWGLPTAEYQERADLWPLDPNGEVISVIYIENEEGVRNIRDILRNVRGISMVHPGEGDLGVWYGDPAKTEQAIQTVLAACLEFNVPCVMTSANMEERIRQGFRVFYGDAQSIENGRRWSGRAP
jgi:4-hydroxy-2-oxoheptanedioate aldolase